MWLCSPVFIKVLLETLPDGRTPPMQQYPLVDLTDLQQLTDLFGVEALDIAQGNHDALAFGQRGNRRPQLRACFE